MQADPPHSGEARESDASSFLSVFRPRLFQDLESYTAETARADLIAGLIVGIVALPLSMALAIATGLPPMLGLFTAIFAGGAIALLGGSSYQVSGPTAAFIVVLVPIVAQFGVNGLMVAGLLAGILLILMGLFRFGALIRYIPYPVTTGFTAGIAVSIATTQLAGLLGLQLPPRIGVAEDHHLLLSVSPDQWALLDEAHRTNFTRLEYHEKIEVLLHQLPTLNWHVVLVSALALGILITWPKLVSKRVPAPLPALVVATLLTLAMRYGLGWTDVTLLGEKFSILSQLTFALPGTLDPRAFMTADAIANASATYFAPFEWSVKNLRELLPAAFSIAMLGAIESLLSAVVADGMTETRHDSNTELIAQGIGNVLSPFFGGIAATGAIARTATNIRNGARTPLASVFHAGTVLLIVLLAAPLAAYIPLCALSAVLLMVCWNMAEIEHFIGLLRAPKSDVLVLLTCFFLTVLVDMVWAVTVGIVLASLLFMRRMSELTDVRMSEHDHDVDIRGRKLSELKVPRSVLVYSIDGPFCFGATEKAVQQLGVVSDRTRAVVLRMRRVPAMDATGLYALRKVHEQLKKRGVALVLSGVQHQPREVLTRAGFTETLGEDNVCADIDSALYRAAVLVDGMTRPANG